MTWNTFTTQAPRIADVFGRRHAATGKLCLLATLRRDGSPRICPMEPRVFDGELWLVGMPQTAKFRDLSRDPRFALHTATADPDVTDGDAKIWGHTEHVDDHDVQRRFAQHLYDDIGLDVRGQHFDQFLQANIEGAAAVTLIDGHLDITTWRIGQPERITRKH
jgi:predicted pyridoxine 5'-phosphate oxidase superfamily flavin-nucleotide-binding protein